MKAKCGDNDWTAVTVVPGVVDMLQSERGIDAAPEMKRVIRLENVLAAVIEAAEDVIQIIHSYLK